MTNSHVIDYREILSDIRAKQTEQNKAIAEFEAAFNKLVALGLLSGLPAQKPDGDSLVTPEIIDPQIMNLRGKSAYEAAVGLLKIRGKPLHTSEIFNQLKSHGVFPQTTQQTTVASALYRAIKERKHARIEQAGRGMWQFKDTVEDLL